MTYVRNVRQSPKPLERPPALFIDETICGPRASGRELSRPSLQSGRQATGSIGIAMNQLSPPARLPSAPRFFS